MNGLTKIAVFFYSLAVSLAAIAQAGEYRWPLKITSQLSSHFADYRAGHWHAGLDITTRGKTGYKVYAVADGYIYRIRAGFWGYGKSLYLKLNDGNYAVYGHLTRFSPGLEDYLDREQRKNNQYYQDIFFSSGQYPVKKGEYIALSGQSGAGAPHLHFEIRDPDNLPVNPLKGFYNVSDDRSPVVEFLVIKRYEAVGLANYHDYEFLRLQGRSPNYTVADTIAIYGEAVLAVSGYDKNNSFNYGLYGVDMILDGAEIFSFRSDRLDYLSGRQIDYVRDNSLKSLVEKNNGVQADNDKNIFYKLYIQPDDKQSFYGKYDYPAGVIYADKLPEGVHSLLIVISDENNNRSQIQVYLKKAIDDKPKIVEAMPENGKLIFRFQEMPKDARPQIQMRRAAHLPYMDIASEFQEFDATLSFYPASNMNDYRLRIVDSRSDFSPWVEFKPLPDNESAIPYSDLLDVVVQKDELLTINDEMLANYYSLPLGGGYLKAQVPVPVDNGYFELALNGDPGTPGFYVFDYGSQAYSPDSSVMLYLSPAQIYDKVILRITSPARDDDHGYTFKILPDEVLFKDDVEIRIFPERLDIDSDKTSIYYYSPGSRKWYYIGDDSSKILNGRTGGGGKFGIFEDTSPPAITGVRPKNNGHIEDKTPALSCTITDDLSGIKREGQLEMTIDGFWVPAYYDIDNKVFSYQVKNPLKKGQHTLRISAADNQGNKASVVSRFDIR